MQRAGVLNELGIGDFVRADYIVGIRARHRIVGLDTKRRGGGALRCKQILGLVARIAEYNILAFRAIGAPPDVLAFVDRIALAHID